MIFASEEGEGVMERRTLREFYATNQFQMRTRGEGAKKSKNLRGPHKWNLPNLFGYFKLWRSAGHPAPPRSVDDGHTRGGEDHDRLEGQRLFLPGVDRGPRSRAHGA